MSHQIRCGSCKGTHRSVEAVRYCHTNRDCIWQIPCAFGYQVGYQVGSYDEVLSVDEAVAEAEEFARQQEAEIWAENAWLRHAENQGAWEPDDDRFAPVYRW